MKKGLEFENLTRGAQLINKSPNFSENYQRRDFGMGFFFTLPKSLLSGRNETVCLTLQTPPKPTKAMVDLKIKEKHYITTRDIITGKYQ